ncbi:Aspartate/alanine antiporter [invertebrate metagenome]|uniref:Aspartate/alanine antiporter n=1 Tax=invertebrate metagenome TaxID=1711999 RepID=A0A2H9T6H3_9ZZZZ
MVFGGFNFNVGNSAGLLISGILMGYFRSLHPTIGHVHQAALRLLKDLGLLVFMCGMGLGAGKGLTEYMSTVGLILVGYGLLVGTIPVVLSYIFGHYVLKMNPALLLGAITGARTCAPAMETVNELSSSTIPAMGYAGTYAVANVLFTMAGTFIVSFF